MKDMHGRTKWVQGGAVQAFETIKSSLWNRFHISVWDRLTNLFKRQVLIGVPRYHLVNVSADALLMFTAGFKNPNMLRLARLVWKDGPSGQTILKTRDGQMVTRNQ